MWHPEVPFDVPFPFRTVPPLSVPDIAQINLGRIPKARLLARAWSLSTFAWSDRVSSLTLCCQPASFITPSPSLGHAMPLTGDGCLLFKDIWVMVPIQTSRRDGNPCHSLSVLYRAKWKRKTMQQASWSRGAAWEKCCFLSIVVPFEALRTPNFSKPTKTQGVLL